MSEGGAETATGPVSPGLVDPEADDGATTGATGLPAADDGTGAATGDAGPNAQPASETTGTLG